MQPVAGCVGTLPCEMLTPLTDPVHWAPACACHAPVREFLQRRREAHLSFGPGCASPAVLVAGVPATQPNEAETTASATGRFTTCALPCLDADLLPPQRKLAARCIRRNIAGLPRSCMQVRAAGLLGLGAWHSHLCLHMVIELPAKLSLVPGWPKTDSPWYTDCFQLTDCW